MDEADNDASWPKGWEGHRKAQLEYWASLPLHVKVAWLEEAQQMVEHLERTRKAQQTPVICEDRIDAA